MTSQVVPDVPDAPTTAPAGPPAEATWSEDLGAATPKLAFGALPSGVVAVAALSTTRLVGMGMSTCIPVSLDPPLVAISVQRTSQTWLKLRQLEALGLSVLGRGQGDLAMQLAGPAHDRFTGVRASASSSLSRPSA
jgi:flavin reductase (DIM6/NTAB) family NADH-FMN oxidoreductase RutF